MIKFYLSVFLFFFGTVAEITYSDWIKYVYHLYSHQKNTILNRVDIKDKNIFLSEEENKKITLIHNVQSFGKKLYQLKTSHSFRYFVKLNRDVLGWNLTAAYPLKWEAVEFHFPVAGTFSYLGFFDNDLKNKWIEKFNIKGYDVYESEIGAYSTLGYFSDPLFSTYLKFSDYGLISTVLHEMSHEKLYFKNDTFFSESLSSFIEEVAAERYLQQNKIKFNRISMNLYNQEFSAFRKAFELVKKKLTLLYQSQIDEKQKLTHKNRILMDYKKTLINQNEKFRVCKIPDQILRSKEINNAVLIQFDRYNPPKEEESNFSLLLKESNNDINIWFEKLSKLDTCSNEQRKSFVEGSIVYKKLLSLCL